MSSNNMKIRFTFPILTLNKGGAQRMLVDITNYLVDSGYDVTIVIPPDAGVDYYVKAKIHRSKNAILSENDYPYSDIIVSNFYVTVPTAHQASQNGKGLHIRLSLCYEPIFLPEQNLSFNSYYKTPNLVILSKYQQELIRLLHGLNGQIIPIYVKSTFRDLNIRHLNHTLQISAIVRMPEGGWTWHRDQDYLLEQLTFVKKLYPNIQLNLICPPMEFAKSNELQNLKKTNIFCFFTPSNDEELCSLYSQSDIFVTSSIYEAAPLPGLEAMKCGAALVTVYAGGNEYCNHEKNCLMSYRHEYRLASDIIRLIENPTLRKTLAAKGKQDAEGWTFEKTSTRFEQICITALNDLRKL